MGKIPARFTGQASGEPATLNVGPVFDDDSIEEANTPVVQPTPAPMRPAPLMNQPFTNMPAGPAVQLSAPAGFAPPGVSGEKQFPFGDSFQHKALAVILRTPSVLTDFAQDIKPGYFKDPVHQTIYRLMQSYYSLYKSAPTEAALMELIKEDTKRLGHSDDMLARLATVADEITKADISEAAYLIDRISNFVKFRKALEVTLKMADIVDELDKNGEGDFNKVLPLIRDLNAIGAKGGLGFEFTDNIDNLPAMLLSSDTYSQANKVPIGFSKIDHILDGGLGAGEIAFFVAGAGVGKSTALVNSACAVALAGFNALVITMELKEADYALRCAQRLAMVGKEHVINNSLRYQERQPYINDALKGRLHFKYYPPGRATVDTVRSYFSQLLSHQEEPRQWIVIIDYLEKLKLGGDDRRGNREDWALIGDTVNELIAFGHEFGVPVLSASQTTRQGYAKVARGSGKTHTDKDDIGASWKKVEHADLVLAFDQSEIEKAAGIARIRAMKVRRGRDGFAFRVKDQRPIMRFVEIDHEGREILSYSPRRRPDENVSLILNEDWDQEIPYSDESAGGILIPPAIEIKSYHKEQLDTLLAEQKGIDLEDVVAQHQQDNEASDVREQLAHHETNEDSDAAALAAMRRRGNQ